MATTIWMTPDGDVPRFGSDRYKAYMKEMAVAFPGQYPSELKQIPEVDLSKLESMPQQAAFTYLRNCNACHLSNKGMQDRGHYRGMGCAAYHSNCMEQPTYIVDKSRWHRRSSTFDTCRNR